MNEKKEIVVWAALALVLTIGYLSFTWMTGDEARYYVLAESVLSGQGYVQGHLPGSVQENVTPPVYPLFLAAILGLTGGSIAAAKIATALMFPCVVMLVWKMLGFAAREMGAHSIWTLRSAVTIGCFSTGLLTITPWFMAELPFMLFSFLALWLCLKGGKDASGRYVLMIGALAVASYYTRAAGLAVLAGIGAYYVFNGKWRLAIWFSAGALLLALPWIVRSMMLFGAPDPYIAYLSQRTGGDAAAGYPWARIITDITRSFPAYFYHIMPTSVFAHLMDGRDLLGRLGLSALAPWIKAFFAGSVLWGFFIRCRRFTCLETYWVFYWLLICALPLEAENAYYLFPIFPLAGFYLAVGLGWFGERIRRGCGIWLPTAPAMYVLLVALGTAGVHFIKEWPRWSYGPWEPARYLYYNNPYYDAWATYVEAGEWVREHTEPDAVVASRKAQHFYVFSDRKGWGYHTPEEIGHTSAWEALLNSARQRPTYLVEDGFGRAAPGSAYGITHAVVMEKLLHDNADHLNMMFETGEPATRVWRVSAD